MVNFITHRTLGKTSVLQWFLIFTGDMHPVFVESRSEKSRGFLIAFFGCSTAVGGILVGRERENHRISVRMSGV